ncbi:unnamed protein product [Fusarium graminearum]|nr:unnamed protein product [Fusarium graminearum]
MPDPVRGRKPKSCDSCRKKKVKSSTPPSLLANRSRLDLTTAFLYDVGIRSVDSLQLSEASGPEPYQETLSNSNSDFTDTSDTHCRYSYLEGLQLLNGLPFFSDVGQNSIQLATGSTLTSRFFPSHPNVSPYSSQFSSPGDNQHLLTFDTIKDFATEFASSAQFLIFPTFSLHRFISTTLPFAYKDADSSSERHNGATSARACVRAMLLIADVFGHNIAEVGASTPQEYAKEIERSLPMVMREMTMDGFEALTMLTIYKYFIGDLHSASFLISIITRMIFKLGAHISPPISEPYDKGNINHHMRDLFWVCYSMDKDLCHRIAQPPAINDAHCDLSLPPNYAEMQNSNILSLSQFSPYNPATVPLYPWDIRLSIIKSRIHDDLYSMSALRQSEAEILRRIRYLDEELEVWRLTLPLDHRPTLSFLDKTPVDAHTNTQAIMLRLSYHHCVISIHKARCRMFNPAVGLVGDGHEANLQLLVDASKSILTYLEKALPVVAHECFWIILFYPMTAIFTVFSIALVNTQTNSVHSNLALLRDFTRVIRKIPIRRLTVAEVSHLAFIEDLVAEMSRLMVAAGQKEGY